MVSVLKNDGLVIYPTDTVYAIGCSLFSPKALERLRLIKGIKGKALNLSFICYDLSHISEYAMHLDTPVFKLMKRALPGPYTFILPASSKVPKIFKIKKRTVGIRVPDNSIAREIVKVLEHPVITSSLHDDEIHDYITDPEIIFDTFKNQVDIVIDGGAGGVHPSTVIDCTSGEPEVTRQGLGEATII